ncbi:MAG: cystathionine gamma-synthase [Rhodoluna sp.]
MSEFETRAIHVSQDPDANNGSVIPPIYMSSTHKQDGVGGLRDGFEYNRAANPTRSALQDALANLESGKFGLSFASGLAAEDAIVRATCAPGDHVVLGSDLYGGTFRLMNRIHRSAGIDSEVVDLSDEQALRAAIQPGKTKLVWIETPSNPMLGIFDIAAISKIAKEHGILTVVDNTFATPYLQRPLEYGADIVTHSTTKFLGGHSDILGGAVVVNDADLHEKIRFIQFAAGAVSSPFDAWLTHRSIKTLAVRMDKHCSNAQAVAEFLDAHKNVEQVYYPGLPGHPGHELAKKQMSGFGGIVSLRFKSEKAAKDFCNKTKLFTLAESLGGVESLVNHPAEMTHASAKGSPIEVGGEIVRLSVGIENPKDLIADLEKALS